jgi:membrane protein required for colicin V production
MEIGGFSIFDIIVLVVVGLAALIGLATGFIRGGLFLGSWILAMLAALYAHPYVVPMAEDFVGPGWKATAAAAGITFVVALIILLLLTQLLTKLIRGSRLNMLDRSLGLLAGGLIAIAVLGVVYLPISANFADGEYPDWIENAKTRVIIEQSAIILLQIIPEDLRPNTGLEEDQAGRRATLDQLNAAPPIAGIPGDPREGAARATESGYTDEDADRLEQAIEEQQ